MNNVKELVPNQDNLAVYTSACEGVTQVIKGFTTVSGIAPSS